MAELLRVEGIRKSFSGVEVLHGADLELHAGEVVAIVGENGAGKSTLVKTLMGLLRPDAGKIFIDGKEVRLHNPAEAMSYGIAMIHQELSPILDMTVSENMFLGREVSKFGLTNTRAQNALTAEWLKKLAVNVSPTDRMRDLRIAQMQEVEIVKAISYDSRILIMDEPTSAITDHDAEKLFKTIDMLKERGIGIIFITHRLDEVFRIAERVIVLRDGDHIKTMPIEETTREEIIYLMVGRDITSIYQKCANVIGEPVLEVRNLTQAGKFKNVSFTLHQGEKLGIAGLLGAGRTELVNAIFGVERPDSGEIYVRGKKVDIRNPRQAIDLKIALVPEDRKLYGLNLIMTIRENITMSIDRFKAKFGVMRTSTYNEIANRAVKTLSIRANSIHDWVLGLSGGNQQKVVLAKWLETKPEIILFDEPTRGIDVGAKYEIYELINSLVMEGKSVLIVSSEMEELMGVADRIMVMCEGQLTGELCGAEICQEGIMTLASPVAEAV